MPVLAPGRHLTPKEEVIKASDRCSDTEWGEPLLRAQTNFFLFMKVEKREVYKLGVASLLNDVSSEGIYAILPLYLKDPILVGFVGGLFNGLAYIIKPISGYISDVTGKIKGFVVGGYLLSAISKLFISAVEKSFIPLFVALDRIGKGIRDTPRDVILTEYEKRGWAFGLHRAMDTTGAIIGVILAYFLISTFPIKMSLFILAGIGFLTLVPLVFLRVGEHKREKGIKFKLSLSLVPALVGLSLISPAIYLERAAEITGTSALIPYAGFNIVYAASALLISTRSDAIGRRTLLLCGMVLIALSHLLIWVNNTLLLSLAFLLYGAAFGIVLPTIFARVGDRVMDHIGLNIGIVQLSLGLSILLGSTLAGILVENIGYQGIAIFSLPALATILLRDHF